MLRSSALNGGRHEASRFASLKQRVHASQRFTTHAPPSRTPVTAAFGFFRKKIATAGAIDDLLAAVEGTNRGCKTSNSQRASIDAAINVLQQAAEHGEEFSTDLTATWKLLWTTEKETLFILRNAGWFRTTAGDVYQVIDGQNNTLQNVITFPPSGSFVVQSSIDIAANQRTSFQFQAATLNLPQRSLKLPPYGKGWFDTYFVNSKIRVSKDSRGDTLVVARDGPPRDVAKQPSAL